MLRYLRPKYLASFLRGIVLKLRYGKQCDFNMLRTFFGRGFELSILNGGTVSLQGTRDRIYFGRDVTLICSGGRIEIGAGTFFNAGCRLTSHVGITIGEDCLFSPNVSVYDSDHGIGVGQPIRHRGYDKSRVSIGNNCWLGTNAVILRGAALESDVVVGANSVVRGVLNARSVYAGIPSKLIKTF